MKRTTRQRRPMTPLERVMYIAGLRLMTIPELIGGEPKARTKRRTAGNPCELDFFPAWFVCIGKGDEQHTCFEVACNPCRWTMRHRQKPEGDERPPCYRTGEVKVGMEIKFI